MSLKFSIQKKSLISETGFSVKIENADGLPLSKFSSLLALAKDKEKVEQEVLHFLAKEGVPSEDNPWIIKVPGLSSLKALKLLAATGHLFFEGRLLISDFFTPVEFYYFVEGSTELSISGKLKASKDEFDIRDCDFMTGGPPHWFIKGHFLRLISTEISWRNLHKLLNNPSQDWVKIFLKECQEDVALGGPRIVFQNESASLTQDVAPLPCLILKDRFGAFADLWMLYGEQKVQYGEIVRSPVKRDLKTEELWAQDLLETGFQRKQVGTSQYYCPLDEVPKSLSFLLELGWTLLDFQGNRVVNYSNASLDVQTGQKEILIRGKLRFDDYEASLGDVVGAFNRRENFVTIGSGVVGLLPQNFNKSGLPDLAEDGEIVSGGIKTKKSHFGSLLELFDTPYQISADRSFEQLRQGLLDWNETEVVVLNHFKGTLRPYQQHGVKWLKFLFDQKFHGILADDMGLGKTIQVLAFLSLLDSELPTLIVLPTSLIFNWKNEIERFLEGRSLHIHHGPNRLQQWEAWDKKGIILTSYATLRIDLPMFKVIDFQAIILDEAQAIKNAHTLTAQALTQLNGQFRLSLTGTPIENHLGELWSQFRFLMPELLGSEKDFQNDLQASEGDLRYLQRIKKKIRPFMLRRKKEEVAKDLPEKIEQVVWVEMNPEQRQVYEDYLSGVRGNLFKKVELDGISKHRMEVLEAILRLRQICCHPLLVTAQEGSFVASAKLDVLMQDLETLAEEGKKALVYSQFTSMLGLIAKEFQKRGWNFVYLDGSTHNREKVVTQFQEDASIPFFLISLKAGGVGLNLTSADYVYLFDPWWNEAIENQAIDRAHRIGRQDTVIAKRLIAIESIEEKIQKLKENKRQLIESLFDETYGQTQLSEEDFQFLLS
ncbi:uncharacterized ATP-dependent helicase MPN_020 [Parachlamydia acanthamoebae UV-7]|jgi:superfamily II DNA or RNA helicase|uniref:Uncharacterized ATP-dependent helicase MPN_020 n=2 Tax=Parachlamydia acanthamoebae TaxID=83552 RepID=F8KVQ9_PARAV|nr:DEAD/DEAH box helicase [Parachlamydia acanthamoebae]EFB42186.1 hypothetical protein pah_c014o119 [Parachlamydia acanthamoebae str. Hall's coccus]KIA76399.1 putative ATP-dependent helicase [Parachlamydia acanthamoebae]CCB85195.1 uncharacterized ATP-dependent helicase MPN_020 [Parachlamydia acanthamoebae UV-7]